MVEDPIENDTVPPSGAGLTVAVNVVGAPRQIGLGFAETVVVVSVCSHLE